MPKSVVNSIVLDGKPIAVPPESTLLEAALANDISIPNSCRSGLCQSCLVQVLAGEIPPTAQQGLSENQKLQNYALACQLKPNSNLTISSSGCCQLHQATVLDHSIFNEKIARLRLQVDVDWFAGQYLTLWRSETEGRSYSIASLPNENFIECHVALHSKGSVSPWIYNELSVGDPINISTPCGDCFYTQSMATMPLLLIGYGTGLAPLYGIVRDALQKNHSQPIRLCAAARDHQSFYLVDDLQTLARSYNNFTFDLIAPEESGSAAAFNAIYNWVANESSNLQGWCVFLCGAPELVKKLQKMCFLAGASLQNIHADPFISPKLI